MMSRIPPSIRPKHQDSNHSRFSASRNDIKLCDYRSTLKTANFALSRCLWLIWPGAVTPHSIPRNDSPVGGQRLAFTATLGGCDDLFFSVFADRFGDAFRFVETGMEVIHELSKWTPSLAFLSYVHTLDPLCGRCRTCIPLKHTATASIWHELLEVARPEPGVLCLACVMACGKAIDGCRQAFEARFQLQRQIQ